MWGSSLQRTNVVGVDADEGEFFWDFGTDNAADTSHLAPPEHSFPERCLFPSFDLGAAPTACPEVTVSPPYSPAFSLGEILGSRRAEPTRHV